MNIEFILKVVGVLLLSFVVAIYEGWVLTVLWKWFVASTFALPLLSIPVALGITIIVFAFHASLFRGLEKEDVSDRPWWYIIAVTVLMSTLLLATGFVLTLFM